MPDKDDAIVEAMARAMSWADGYEPGNGPHQYSYDEYIPLARRQLAAHRAMIKAEREQENA